MQLESRTRSGLLGAILVAAISGLFAAPAKADPPSFETDQLIVQIRPGASGREALEDIERQGGQVIKQLDPLGMKVVKVPPGKARAARSALSRNPRFKSVEVDRWHPPSFVPNDPLVSSAWHLEATHLFGAWDFTSGSPGMPLAILDSGVDSSHPDLAGKLVPGWNFHDNNSDTSDVYGHGTKVAGAAAAAGNNGIGVVGAAYANPIMPIRVANSDGWALTSAIAQGLIWAADHGARVANISFGGVQTSSSILSAAQYFTNNGGVVTASAGNTGTNDGSSDSTYIVSVSATGSQDDLASWSSFGNYVDVAAPGVAIQSTFPGGGYGSVSGTSFSAPVTAGIIALIFAANPDLSPAEVEMILEGSADDLGEPGYDIYYGWGKVNAFEAVVAALGTPTAIPDSTPPMTSITSPDGGAVLSGNVTVTATAIDDVAVTEVHFYVDGQLLGVDLTAPYSALWDTSAATAGPHTLLVEARDSAGNLGTSVPVSVEVWIPPDPNIPIVSFTNPLSGEILNNKKVQFVVDASAPAGISHVEILVDGAFVKKDKKAPYVIGLKVSRWSAGEHLITARAIESGGLVSSDSITVTVPASLSKKKKNKKKKQKN